MAESQDLPSYKHPSYVQMEEPLKTLLDVYENLENRKSEYLPREDREPDRAYQQRVQRSTFSNKLRPTIEGNAGLLTAFELVDMPISVEQNKDNLDQRGSDYKSFFQEADTIALRDGLCYILIDYPPVDGDMITAADRVLSDRRAHLTLIDRRNVLNWRTHFEYGKVVIDQVTIELHQEVEDGEFGVKTETLYHHLKRKRVPQENAEPVWRVEHSIWSIDLSGGETKAIARDRRLTQLDEIPLVCYPYSGRPFNTEIPPLLKLARLNLKLFRKESELDEIQHRVNCPTVWRRHPTDDVPANLPPVVFGANFVLEIPQNGEVGVLEIDGSGVQALQNSIDILKKDIDNEGLGFLAGGGSAVTATEAFLSSTQIQASLSGYARDKASAIQEIFRHWCKYTGEENTIAVSFDESLLEMPLDGAELASLLQYYAQGVISHETLLTLLVNGQQLPSGFDVQAELDRIEAEKARQMQATIAASELQMQQEIQKEAQMQAIANSSGVN